MATQLVVPEIGESITSAFIGRWLKQKGQAVRPGESIVELDSDKASLEVPSQVAGVIVDLLAAEGDEVAIGATIAVIDETAEVPEESSAAPVSESPEPENGQGKAGPAARQLAAEKGVDLSQVTGSGHRGQILSTDVTAASTAGASTGAAASTGEGPGRTERVPMTPLRRTIARRLVEAQNTAAMLTTFNEVDMSEVMALRKRYQPKFTERYGIKLGFMSFFLKAAIESLKQFPAVNAEIDGDELVYKNYYNIGVAVSGPKGLVVPVIRDADRLSFAETEQAISEVAGRAQNNRLTLDDFKDGTFTISNGGIFGSMLSTPILNPPQVGILGMHNIVERPVGVNGNIELRPIMYLALSYDHRIIDGREAVSFLLRIKQLIEQPERILLEV